MSTSRPVSVALVDDAVPYRKMLSQYLSKRGFFIACEASNGRELLVQLNELDIVPDVCIPDADMPVMSGYDTAQKLHSAYPGIDIIGHSFFNERRRQKMLDSGVSECVSKRQTPSVLAETMLSLAKGQAA